MLKKNDFELVQKLVYDRSSIVLSEGKSYLVESRLLQLAQTESFPSIDALVEALRVGRTFGLADKIVDAMTTNETNFFRDLHPFEALREVILPAMIEARAQVQTLRVWSAACSSGQEVYSFLILLRENFPELRNWNLEIQASDISDTMLERAQEGRYSQVEISRGMPQAYLQRYFRQEGSDWVVDAGLRDMVKFRRINLCRPWPQMGVWDLVLMRNVLIYFDIGTKRDIFAQLRRVLRPDGSVLLGAAETTMNIDNSFERHQNGSAGYYKLRDGESSDAMRTFTSLFG